MLTAGYTSLSGSDLAHDLTRRIDSEIISLFNSCTKGTLQDWSLIALGGYARGDLCPYSDLDLLVLVEKSTSRSEIEGIIEAIMYPLWDRGYNASYSVRTVKETIKDAKKDFFFRTSLINPRFLSGTDSSFRKLATSLDKNRSINNIRKFMTDLLFHTRRRHDKYGDVSYILEPDIKDGHGGLRDYHTTAWAIDLLSKNGFPVFDVLTRKDKDRLDNAYDFLLKTRFVLHELSGRKNDRMYLEYQEDLADSLGFEDGNTESAVEAFMRHFYKEALKIRSLSDGFLLSLEHMLGLTRSLPNRLIDSHFQVFAGQLAFRHTNILEHSPYLVMKAFELISMNNYTLSPSARSDIVGLLNKGCSLENDTLSHEAFFRILLSNNPGHALHSMLELGVLECFIPEFESIKGRTIFDLYHTYTVDIHSIHTVDELKRLEQTRPEVFASVDDKKALYLAALLHDIGKGYGKDHATTGAGIASSIAVRLGLERKGIDLVDFLIRSHILMADLATTRDLSEERVIVDFARKMRDPSRLAMLYLLTIADSRATGVLAWNEWKDALLAELFAKALHIMEKGIFRDPANPQRLERKWQQLLDLVPEEKGTKQTGRLWSLPQSYILHTDVAVIKRHLSLRNELMRQDDIRLDIISSEKDVTLSIITRDRPGLFSMLTGILALNHLEIISAKVFTWLDGTAVDVFRVVPPWHDYNEWDRITGQFKDAVAGKLHISKKIAATKTLKNPAHAMPPPQTRSSVCIDNETSDFFTLIEVRAPDRQGMLYHTAHAISYSGLDIHRAFLSRSGDLRFDVFYVVDALGEKIMDENRKASLEKELHKVISGSDPVNTVFLPETTAGITTGKKTCL